MSNIVVSYLLALKLEYINWWINVKNFKNFYILLIIKQITKFFSSKRKNYLLIIKNILEKLLKKNYRKSAILILLKLLK